MSEWLAWPGTELMNLRGTRQKHWTSCMYFVLRTVLYRSILYHIISYCIVLYMQHKQFADGDLPWSRKKFAIATLWANCERR